MSGMIGKKIGMTSVFDENGKYTPCTIIQSGPCVVTQIKTKEKDGYDAVQLALDEKKEKRETKAMLGHFKKANTTPKYKLVEFREFDPSWKVGDVITAKYMEDAKIVDVSGISKGKGFQGVVRRHHFAGVGDNTHGQHDRNRAPGSIGASSYPSRVFKGMRMAGRMGGKKTKTDNLKVVKVLSEENLIVVRGSVPGENGSYVLIYK